MTHHEFDPLDKEILERAFDSTSALIGDKCSKAMLRQELIEIAYTNGFSDPQTLEGLLLARLGQVLRKSFRQAVLAHFSWPRGHLNHSARD